MTFTIASKRIKYLGINLAKEDLYIDNYKTFWKKVGTDKEKNRQHSWAARLSIVMMLLSSKALYRFNVITVKIPMTLFCRNRKFNLKFIWNLKGPWIAKTILKKWQSYRSQTSWFQNLLQSYCNQNSSGLKTLRSMEQNREPRNKPLHVESNYFLQGC